MAVSGGIRKRAIAQTHPVCPVAKKLLGLAAAGLALLAGSGKLLGAEISHPSHAAPTEARPSQEIRLAGLIPVAESAEQEPEPSQTYWAFPSEDTQRRKLHLPGMVRVPLVEDNDQPTNEIHSEATGADAALIEPPIAFLLPPKPLTPEQAKSLAQGPTFESIDLAAKPLEAEDVGPTSSFSGDLSEEEQRLIESIARDCSAATTGVPTDARVNELAIAKIRHANQLATRGSLYVAKRELIEVLRMVSQAKDSAQGSPERTLALASGLRALEEAADFSPRGTQLEAELETALLTASHRTPVAQQIDLATVLPQQLMNRYFRYAQLKLAKSVAGEPAGSMALYALGKVTSQMGKAEPDQNRLAQRQAVAFQQAALLSHHQNHFAAHELAVLLAETGHFAEAHRLLYLLATHQPQETVYRNLAHVQQRLGLAQQSANSLARANQLAQQSPTASRGVRWISPQEFSRPGIRLPSFAERPAGFATPVTLRPQYDRRTAMTPPRAAAPVSMPPQPRTWR